MSAPGVVTFRLFSGPHVGAELVFQAGSYVIGTDDSCDIILHDTSVAARHAQFLVTVLAEHGDQPDSGPESGATPTSGKDSVPGVQVFPLDGNVTENGVPLSEGQPLLPQTPYFLGLTCLAWARYGDREAAWQEISEQLRNPAAPSASMASDQPDESGSASGTTASNERLAQPPTETSALATTPQVPANTFGTLVLPAAQTVQRRRQKRIRLLLGLLVVMGLCGLTVTYEKRSNSLTQYVAIIEQKLKSAGYERLNVVLQKRGVTIQGLLRNDTERGELVKLAQNVHFPVYLDVSVRTDRLDAITAAFNSRQLYPLVQEEQGEEGGALRISGYMKDGLIEQWAFNAVYEDVPDLAKAGPKGVVRHIRHADAVAAVLAPALVEADLEFVQVIYHNGTIDLIGAFDTDQRTRLETTLDNVRLELGIPLNVQVLATVAETPRADVSRPGGATFAAASGGKKGQRDAASEVTSPDDIRIVGVTMTPMRFVSLASGERIFEGGLLPGGYILESINIRQLRLRKDGRVFDYQLRGSNG